MRVPSWIYWLRTSTGWDTALQGTLVPWFRKLCPSFTAQGFEHTSGSKIGLSPTVSSGCFNPLSTGRSHFLWKTSHEANPQGASPIRNPRVMSS